VKVSAVHPWTIIGNLRVPSFVSPRFQLSSNNISRRNLEWWDNRAASTLNPCPSTSGSLSMGYPDKLIIAHTENTIIKTSCS